MPSYGWANRCVSIYTGANGEDEEERDIKRFHIGARALYALGSYLPGFPLLWMPGSRIDITRSLEMGYGFILGPVYGPITAFIGALVGKVITGGGFGLYFTPLAPLTAFVAAPLSSKKVFKVRGWILSAAITAVLIFGWYLTSVGRSVLFYPVLHFMGLLIILVFRDRLAGYIHGEHRMRLSMGVALTSYSSTIVGHMLGNLIFMGLIEASPAFFIGILPVTAAERLFITLLSTTLMKPLILVVREVFPDIIIEGLG